MIAAALAMAATVGTDLLLTQRLQLVLGLTPLHAGLIVTAFAAGSLPVGVLAGGLLHRTGVRPLIGGGLFLGALGVLVTLLLTPGAVPLLGGGRSPAWVVPGLVLAGAGLGIVMVAASAAIISGAPPQRAGMASSIESVSYELGSLAGVTVLGTILIAVYTHTIHLPATAPARAAGSIDRARAAAGHLPAGQARTLLDAAASAFDNGYTLALAITAIALAAGSAFTYRYLTRQPATAAEQAQHPEPAQHGGQPPERPAPEDKPPRFSDDDVQPSPPQEVPMTVHVSSKPADGASRLPVAAWLVLGIVLVADIMDLLDATITTIAAPTISSSLHGGPGLIKWLGASYALALGVLLVTGGRLGDKYGRRRTFLIGIAGFTAASLACGLAWDPPSIIVARLVQGAFGALLIPQGFGILGSVFPREHIGKAFSAFGPILGLSAVGGPLLAGLLIDANLFGLGWRPMFLINIVLGAAGLAAGLRLLLRDVGDRAVRIDALGSALLAACMLGLLFGLIQGSTDGWTAAPVAVLAAGVIFFAAFAQRQRTSAAPLIKPSLLRNRGFTAGLILGLVFFATVAGLLYAVSLFLQRGVGYSPERAAVTGFAPAAAGIVIASVACRNLLTRLGRRLSLAGIVVTVGGVTVLATIVARSGTAASAAELAPAMTLIGLGMGATFATIYDIAIGDIDPAEAGSASGSLSSVQQLANAIGAAVITTIYLGALAGGPAHAMTLSLLTVIAIGVLSCLAIPLLPRHAQPAGPH